MTPKSNFFERCSNAASSFTGTSWAFSAALIIVLIWAGSGPFFNYSETWQLIINTGTTIITFLMVFLIQKAQNKDSKAIQIKLNELIAASRRASNRLVDIEDLDECELDKLKEYYQKLAERVQQRTEMQSSQSIDDAMPEVIKPEYTSKSVFKVK